MDGAKADRNRIHGWIDGAASGEDGRAGHIEVLRAMDSAVPIDHTAAFEGAHARPSYVMVTSSKEQLGVQEGRLVERQLEPCFVMRSSVGGEEHHRLPDP